MYSLIFHENHTNRVFHSRFRGVSRPTIVLDTPVEFVSKTATLGSYIISHFVHQARQRKETYSWVGFVNSCKTKINCKKQCSCLKTISVHHHIGLQLLQFVLRKHSWYSTSWLAVVVFVCVKLCIYRQ
jgi:hypothetical protein